DLGYGHPHFEMGQDTLGTAIDVASYKERTQTLWQDFNVTEMHFFNYGNENMHVLVSGHLDYNNRFNGIGEAVYKVNTGELISKKIPENSSYLDGVKNTLLRLHFGDYGGYALKAISFVLGIITCFVILSGVMIWLVARDKANTPGRKRRFNRGLVNVYWAICLSMYPITALSFIAVKIGHPADQSFIYWFYFMGWLILALFFMVKK